MACGNKLVCPKLQKGQELNGVLIHKVYKTKALYVKPSRMLLVSMHAHARAHTSIDHICMYVFLSISG